MACNRVLVLSVLLLALCWLNPIDARRHRSATRARIPDELDYSKDPARVVQRVVKSKENSWFYVTVAALEGQQAKHGLLKDGKVVPLSVSMLSECWKRIVTKDWHFNPLWGLEYVRRHGLSPASLAPQDCVHNPAHDLMKNITIFTDFAVARERNFPSVDQMLTKLVDSGPLMVGIDSATIEKEENDSLMPCVPSKKFDHFVLLVGYDKEKLIFKDSRGENWGQGGFGHIERTKACNPFNLVVY